MGSEGEARPQVVHRRFWDTGYCLFLSLSNDSLLKRALGSNWSEGYILQKGRMKMLF